jgi:hypothetical protein
MKAYQADEAWRQSEKARQLEEVIHPHGVDTSGSAGQPADNRPACFGNTMCPVGTTCVHEVYPNGFVKAYCH